ncbi:MAG TPA: hypothetical protein VGI74_12025 [Streptosporangiaceae bacterium]|jgi:hypothetical protein
MQVFVLDLRDLGEQVVEVVGDSEMAAGKAITVAGRQSRDEPRRLVGIGTVAGGP